MPELRGEAGLLQIYLPEAEPGENIFDIALGELADRMRNYDAMVVELDEIAQREHDVYETLNEFEENDALAGFKAPEMLYPSGVAYDALRVVLGWKKAAELAEERDRLSRASRAINTDSLLSSWVTVAALEAEEYKIYTTRAGFNSGSGEKRSQKYTTQDGRVHQLRLDVETGGTLILAPNNPFKDKRYVVEPLIDRGTGYKPAFSITPS